ncbi:flavin reductase family protein [Labedella phragmitis]|uniref:flavin reductase family protein n=1 Tax=Labedella phragmitis TaxID=2498849 RepID=UPI001FB77085|nr:flavin reductase family protein [Labedella phragmitis]
MSVTNSAASFSDESTPRLGFEGVGPDEFKAIFRHHAAGVSLITADNGSGPAALTATSVFSVSAEPPIFVFSISSSSSAAPVITTTETLVVHILDADRLDLAKLGATSGVDRFADAASWTRLPTGEPVFTGVSTWIRGRVINRMEAGNSTIIAVHALETSQTATDGGTREHGAPLVYHNRTWHSLGEHSALDS